MDSEIDQKSRGEILEFLKSNFQEDYFCHSINLVALKKRCGVYVLHQSGKPFYIGKTTNLLLRITQHVESKEFDSFSFIPLPSEHLDYLERMLIKKIKPFGNVMHTEKASELRKKGHYDRMMRFGNMTERDFNKWFNSELANTIHLPPKLFNRWKVSVLNLRKKGLEIKNKQVENKRMV